MVTISIWRDKRSPFPTYSKQYIIFENNLFPIRGSYIHTFFPFKNLYNKLIISLLQEIFDFIPKTKTLLRGLAPELRGGMMAPPLRHEQITTKLPHSFSKAFNAHKSPLNRNVTYSYKKNSLRSFDLREFVISLPTSCSLLSLAQRKKQRDIHPLQGLPLYGEDATAPPVALSLRYPRTIIGPGCFFIGPR